MRTSRVHAKWRRHITYAKYSCLVEGLGWKAANQLRTTLMPAPAATLLSKPSDPAVALGRIDFVTLHRIAHVRSLVWRSGRTGVGGCNNIGELKWWQDVSAGCVLMQGSTE